MGYVDEGSDDSLQNLEIEYYSGDILTKVDIQNKLIMGLNDDTFPFIHSFFQNIGVDYVPLVKDYYEDGNFVSPDRLIIEGFEFPNIIYSPTG